MNATREADELVRLWQELQEAQVAGDARRLAVVRAHAEARGRRPEASPEWELLAREAGRQSGHLEQSYEAQPTVGVGAEVGQPPPAAEEQWRVDEVSAPDAATEPAEVGRRGGRSLGPLIWVVLVVGYVLLQLIGGFTDEGP